jgi:hypothetical protein
MMRFIMLAHAVSSALLLLLVSGTRGSPARGGDLVKIDTLKARAGLVRKERAEIEAFHDIVISVKQNNRERLEAELLARSTPGNALYQQWMTYDEISQVSRNDEAFTSVMEWLGVAPKHTHTVEGSQNSAEDIHIHLRPPTEPFSQHDGGGHGDVSVTWVSKRKDYIRVRAKISTWESLLGTPFYHFEEELSRERVEYDGLEASTRRHVRAEHCHLPREMIGHVEALFNVCDAPPHLVHFGKAIPRTPHRDEGTSEKQSDTETSNESPAFSKFVRNKYLRSPHIDSMQHGADSQKLREEKEFQHEFSAEATSDVDIDFLASLYDIPIHLGEQIHGTLDGYIHT